MKLEHVLKLTGKASIPEALELGHNYMINVAGSITSENKTDSQGEAWVIYYKFEPVTVEVITPKGKSIRAKDTRRLSQQMRSLLFLRWRESNDPEEFESWYAKRMKEIMKTL